MLINFLTLSTFLVSSLLFVYLALYSTLPIAIIPLGFYTGFHLLALFAGFYPQTASTAEIVWGTFFAFAFLGALAVIVIALKNHIENEHHKTLGKFKESEKSENKLRNDNKSQIIENLQIETDYENTIKLYETIQNMSGTLETDNIIRIFVNTMTELVPLAKGTIVLFAALDDKDSEDRYFTFQSSISTSKMVEVMEDKRQNNYEEFISRYKQEPKEFYFEPEEKDKYSPYRIKHMDHSLAVLPIKSDKFISGAVIVEGSQQRYMEQLRTITTFLGIEIKKSNLFEKVKRLSVNDGLTGLLVRRYFQKRIEETFAAPSEKETILSLLIVDVDKFKNVNDKFGHQAGDLVLKETARMLEKNAREIDLVCRFGGDEFSIGLPNTTKDEALQIAERLRVSIQNHRIPFESTTLHATVSIGVASYPEDGQDFKTLYSYADLALYAAKNTGSNRVLSFQKALLQ